MENQDNNSQRERGRLLGGVASVLNAGGSALVYAYDAGGGAMGKLYSALKKTPAAPAKAFDKVVGSLGFLKPGEARKLQEKIGRYNKKIKGLYYEIGKVGAKEEDEETPLASEPVKKLIADVREYEKEIKRLENRIREIRTEKREKATKKKEKKVKAAVAVKKRKVSEEELLEKVRSTIERAGKQGIFDSSAERAIFDKVASDLLDNEMEIKTLAAAELGKLGNEACVPILLAAAEFDNPELTSEIINSLTGIGAHEAVSLFKEKISDTHHRIRIGCLRGLHKLADDEDTIPMLTEALKDSHPEVRRTAATFLGWKDSNEAVPALMQCLRDDDVKVRKAAVSALANIKDEVSIPALIKSLGDKNLEIREKALETITVISGEEIEFDVHTSGKALKNAVAELRSWWEDRKIGELDADPMVDSTTDDETAEEMEAGAPDVDDSMDVAEISETRDEAEAAAVEAEAEEPDTEADEIETEAPADDLMDEAEIPETGAEAADVEVDTEEAETAAADTEAEELATAETDTEAEDEETPQYTEHQLMRMVKSDLMIICDDLGIEYDDTATKSELSMLILRETNA